MTLRHCNRIRSNNGEQVLRDLEAAEASYGDDPSPPKWEIRERAYELYLRRNGGSGDADTDWLQAEHEVRARRVTVRPNTVSELVGISA